jgi:hypothetical protein
MPENLISAPDVSPVAPQAIREEYAAVELILASRHFAKAPLLSAFLMYVAQRALEDGMVRISEYEIGLNVFQRSASFDPREDNIVRTYARHLRKRLQEYYETDGVTDSIRITLPKGTYIPTFQVCETQQAEIIPSAFHRMPEKHAAPVALPSSGSWQRYWWVFGVTALLLATFATLLFSIRRPSTPPQPPTQAQSLLHPLWERLFRPDRDTFIVPGDIGFVILQQANNRTFSLAEYLNWFSSQSSDAHLAMSYLRDQTYTSVLNLGIVSNLQRLPETTANHFIIRAAKNVRFDDLRDGNVILLGSNYSNPWDEIFSDRLNFHFVNHPNEDLFWITNKRPLAGEASVYESTTTNSTHRTYAVIAFVQNLNKNGYVLLIQGLDTAGTQTAADMLFSSDAMQDVIQRATSQSGEIKSFEVLIAVDSLDANSHAMSSRIVTTRIHE